MVDNDIKAPTEIYVNTEYWFNEDKKPASSLKISIFEITPSGKKDLKKGVDYTLTTANSFDKCLLLRVDHKL